jgi:K+-sensing histidine kinase KdpD
MEDKTFFASAPRLSEKDILIENQIIGSQKFFTEIFGTIHGVCAVINRERQIIYANDDFLSLLGINSIESILGKRPGEVVSCIHSAEQPGGCGTSYSCAYCGAVNAILESQSTGSKAIKETRITSVLEGKTRSLDLRVSSSPITVAGEVFYVLMLLDISDEKRRAALERIFFHDLLNTAGGLNGLLTILKDGADPEEVSELINLSEEASRDIIDEIMLHRQIRAAENGDLQVKIETVNSVIFLTAAIGKIKSHEVGQDKNIILSDSSVSIDFETDRTLLLRVIINLLKNALEATPKGESISAGTEESGEMIRFWIKNDAVIPTDVQNQLFQRSFSTKGNGRGIGTYSIRLLTENYLKGKASFVSNENEGTVFNIELNKKISADLADSRR